MLCILRGNTMKFITLALTAGMCFMSVTGDAAGQISISPEVREFASDGGGGYILTSGTGTWTATTAETWLSIQPRTNGTADQPCIYVVKKYAGTENRDGQIIINDNIHTVIQYGVRDQLPEAPSANAVVRQETPPAAHQSVKQEIVHNAPISIGSASITNADKGEYLIDRSIGILVPFEINNDESSVSPSFKDDFNGDIELPTQYARYIESNVVFKSVILANNGLKADYYLTGYVKKVHLGNRFLRFYSWTSMFGGGRSSIELTVSLLSSDKKVVFQRDISQVARRTGSMFRSAMWSHKANLQTAIDATKDEVLICALIGVIQNDPSCLEELFSLEHPTHIRDVSKMVYSGAIKPSQSLSKGYSMIIAKYLQQPNADAYVIDAIAWVCMAIGEAKMYDNISDLEMLINSEGNKKIVKKAIAAKGMLN